MRLFRRIGDIIAANLNDLVDRFEDPELMLKQAIREMETMIEGATGAAARAIAGERLLAKELSVHERQGLGWRAKAEAAVADGDDNLARVAIARAFEHKALASALTAQRADAGSTAQALRGQVDAMKAKQAEARRKFASLSAHRQVVAAGRALRGAACESSRATTGFARFARMQGRIEQAEAEAKALAELYDAERSVPEVEAEAHEQARCVEAELTTIKERLRSSDETRG